MERTPTRRVMRRYLPLPSPTPAARPLTASAVLSDSDRYTLGRMLPPRLLLRQRWPRTGCKQLVLLQRRRRVAEALYGLLVHVRHHAQRPGRQVLDQRLLLGRQHGLLLRERQNKRRPQHSLSLQELEASRGAVLQQRMRHCAKWARRLLQIVRGG